MFFGSTFEFNRKMLILISGYQYLPLLSLVFLKFSLYWNIIAGLLQFIVLVSVGLICFRKFIFNSSRFFKNLNNINDVLFVIFNFFQVAMKLHQIDQPMIPDWSKMEE